VERGEIIKLLKSNLSIIQSRFGVKDILLFGSVARNDAKPGSDVDILVEFAQQPGFDRFMELRFFLEDLLLAKVDLVTRSALRPRMRPIIEKEALHVA